MQIETFLEGILHSPLTIFREIVNLGYKSDLINYWMKLDLYPNLIGFVAVPLMYFDMNCIAFYATQLITT